MWERSTQPADGTQHCGVARVVGKNAPHCTAEYADENGVPSMDITVNPNGSVQAIEGITSPDGRVFGRMAHSERAGFGLYKNVPGQDSFKIFNGAVDYFTK